MQNTETFTQNQQLKLVQNRLTIANNGVCNTALDEKPVADENGTIPDPCFSRN